MHFWCFVSRFEYETSKINFQVLKLGIRVSVGDKTLLQLNNTRKSWKGKVNRTKVDRTRRWWWWLWQEGRELLLAVQRAVESREEEVEVVEASPIPSVFGRQRVREGALYLHMHMPRRLMTEDILYLWTKYPHNRNPFLLQQYIYIYILHNLYH